MENNIEEDIKDLEKYIKFANNSENFSHDADWNWHKEIAKNSKYFGRLQATSRRISTGRP